MDRTDKKVDISIIVCVYNGGEFFKKNIESVSQLKIPKDTKIEVLIVNSGSTDGTPTIIKEYVKKYPDTFRYFNEHAGGLSHAKNLAVKKAKGEILAFTDADTILPEDWLLRIKEGFQKHGCAALGGQVLPVWETAPPEWFMRETNNGNRCGVLSLWNGEEKGYYPVEKGTSFPTGCNSAVKKETFLKYGGYRSDLGVWPNLRLGGEETEFFYRIQIAGEKIFYHPPMMVYHQIPENRLTKQYLCWTNFMFRLSSLYLRSLYPAKKRDKLLKNLLTLPKTLFKFILSGFSTRLTRHSHFHYQIRLQNIFCDLGFRMFGLDKTVKLARISGYIRR